MAGEATSGSRQRTVEVVSDTGASEHKSWSEAQGLQTFRKPSYQPNGNVFDFQGRLFTCEHESRALSITGTDLSGRFWWIVLKASGSIYHSTARMPPLHKSEAMF